MRRAAQQGFTLLELIMVIVILALASVPILGQFSQVSSSMLMDEEIQTAAQLAQERAEGILAERRNLGYAAILTGTTIDTLTGNFSAYARSVTVNEPPLGSGCAPGASCKEVVVSVNHGSSPRAAVSTILVDY
jgi:prepilin-type N-terminal cleavage/methylation domain-containing protein